MNSLELNLQKIEGDNGGKCLKIFLDNKEKMGKIPLIKDKTSGMGMMICGPSE